MKTNLKFIKKGSILLTAIVGFYILLIYSSFFAPVTSLCCDASSWVTAADAQIQGYGAAYTHFWDIKPPGLVMVTQFWLFLFGSHIISLKIFDFIIAVGVFVLLWFVAEKAFPWWMARPLVLATAFPLYSQAIQTQFLSSEMSGLLVSLAGLSILLSERLSLRYRLSISSFFFFLSGQIKDPYLPALLAVLPYIIFAFKDGLGAVVVRCRDVVVGIGAGLLSILLFLLANNSVTTYQAVLTYKQEAFSILESEKYLSPIIVYMQRTGETFLQLQYAYILVIVGAALLYPVRLLYTHAVKVSSTAGTLLVHLKIKGTNEMLNKLIILCYCLGSIIGFAMQGRLGFHYYIQIVPVVFLGLGIIIETIRQNLIAMIEEVTSFRTVVLIISFAVFLLMLPKKEYLKEYLYPSKLKSLFSAQAYTTPENELEFQDYMQSRLGSNDCVYSAYGWTTARFYYLLKRPPCSQYYILNILTDEQKIELKEDLVRTPPQAIQYVRGGADMDIEYFEALHFNFTAVLSACYHRDEKYNTIFFAKFSGDEQAECVRANG